MAAQVGAAYIKVAPNLAGFHRTITKELKSLSPQVKKIGLGLGRNLGDGIKVGLGDPLSGPLDESTKKQRQKGPKQGEEVAGAFAKGFEKRLKAAFQALPKAEIDADSSPADKKIAELRRQLEALSGKTVGVDIDAGAALSEVAAIRSELEALDGHESIQVDVDAAAALAELTAVQVEVDRVDGRTARVNVNADVLPALAGIGLVSTALLGLTAIPIAATVGVGILSLVGPLGAAGAGFAGLAAVATPSINRIGEALKVQKQAQDASTGSAAQAAAANKKLAATMAALSPAERDVLKSWNGLRTAFTGWAKELQPAVLPLFTRGINLVKQALPGLTPIVKGAAGAVNGLLGDVTRAAQSPFWRQLRTNITGLVPTSITGFGKIAGNIATGLAGIVSAFLPYAPTILSFITRITAGFARWGQGLGTSNGFAKFMAYVKQNAPLILETVKQLGLSIAHIVSSLAPLGPAVLGGFGLLLRFIGMLTPGEIQAIAIAFTLLSVSIWAVNFALEANPVVLVITLIVALVAAVVLAFNHVTWFHNAVVAAFNGIKAAVLFVWNSVLKPTFSALVVAFQAISTVVMWLWRNVISPAFSAISLAARILFAIVAVAVLAPLVIAFNILKAVILAWWHIVVVPAFAAVQAVIAAAWVVIHPILAALGVAVRAVGAAAMWLWHNAIVPAWNGISLAIATVYNTVIHPILNALNAVLRNVIAPVFRWIYTSVIKPMFQAAGAVIRNVWNTAISPAFNALKSGVNAVKNAFSTAVSAIGRIWKGLESATKKPVQFVVNTVYNNGIRSVWNKVAGLVHLPQLPAAKFAQGGIFPGYTPGKDPYSMPMAAFSGGEAVMRPEFTRAVGPGFVYAANKVARKRGPGGVRDFLANGEMKFATGGILPGRHVAAFANGGIIGGILGAVKRASSLVVRGASSVLGGGASAFAKTVLNPILSRIPGADSPWAQGILSLPKRMIDGFISWLHTAIDPKLGGDAHGVVAAAKKYIGIGDDRGPNNNIFSRWWGMPGGPWCFAAGTLVDTPQGLVPIENLKVGDPVYTGTGNVQRVSCLYRRQKELWRVVAMGMPETFTTEDHPYLVRKRLAGRKRAFAEPQRTSVKDLRKGDLIGLPLGPEGTTKYDPDLSYVLGMYVADGCRSKGTVIFSDAPGETERILTALKRAGFDRAWTTRNGGGTNTGITDSGLYELCGKFGDLAHNKEIPDEVHAWDAAARTAFVEGFLAGDGHLNDAISCGGSPRWEVTTVSPKLAVGLAKLLRSLGFLPSVNDGRPEQSLTICGRDTHCRKQFKLSWRNAHRDELTYHHYVEEDGVIWVPVREAEPTGRVECVYDITVPGEHTFIANGAYSFNCAMFVSRVIKDAHAEKYYSGYPTALAAGYNSMRHVSSGQAGDLATYNGGGHINIIEKPAGGAYMTIGGNQNALVQRGIRSPGLILRPAFANGGIIGREAQRLFKHDAPRQIDKHELQTPMVQLMRSLPSGQMSNVVRAITKKHLTVANAGVYDDGGVIAPGLNLVANASRKPEALLSNAQWRGITEAAAGGDTHYHAHLDEMTQAAYGTQIRSTFHAMETQRAMKERIGRRR